MSDNNNNIVKMSVDVETSTTTTSTITTTNTNAPIAITAAMLGIPNTAPNTLFGQHVSTRETLLLICLVSVSETKN